MARQPVHAERMVLQKVYVDEAKWARVQIIARAHRVSASELIRQAMTQVLCVAETQQRTIEAVVRAMEDRHESG